MGNKIDKQGAVSEEELREFFGLTTKTTFGTQKLDKLNGKPIELFMCAVVKKTGFKQAFEWLTNQIP